MRWDTRADLPQVTAKLSLGAAAVMLSVSPWMVPEGRKGKIFTPGS